MKKIITVLAAATVPAFGLGVPVASAAPAHPAVFTCGSWRWPVKTGADRDRYKVSRTVFLTTVAHLRSFTRPSSFPAYYQDHRFRRAERRIWQVTTELLKIKYEDDGDIHMVLRNSAGKEMIAEIPLGRCVAARSLWKRRIAAARSYITSRYHLSLYNWTYTKRRATIRGLGFFDEIHNVTGQAPNGIELHPVTLVRFP